MAHPVFFDENGRRARIVNIVLVFVACTCALLLVGVVYALLATPDLPRLGVMRSAAGAAGESPIAAQTGPADRTSPAQPVSLDVNRRVSPTAARALRFAFYEDAPGAFS